MPKVKRVLPAAKGSDLLHLPFGTRLEHILAQRKISKSDLARMMWPDPDLIRIDARGYEFHANKSQISKWCKNQTVPNAINLARLCEVLNMRVEDLAPDLMSEGGSGETKDIEMSIVTGRPDVARLHINLLVPTDVAVKVIALLTAETNKSK